MSRRLSYRPSLLIATVGPILSLVVLVCREVQLFYHEDPDFWLDITNFAVVLLPFAFSILFAFVPDMRTKHIAWRTAVVLIGIGFSWMLWKQQRLAADATKRDQQSAVQTAIRQSNEHSDQQIAGVRKDVQTETVTLDDKMKALSGQVSTTEAHINGAIKGVITPVPQYAKLQFSLFAGSTTPLPLTTQSLSADKDGVFTVDFVVTNISDTTTAKTGDIWVFVCDDCTFSEEPKGFDRPGGLNEHARHKMFQNLNPGVTLETMTVKVKPGKPYGALILSLRYSCETCGKMADQQDVRILATYPLLKPATP